MSNQLQLQQTPPIKPENTDLPFFVDDPQIDKISVVLRIDDPEDRNSTKGAIREAVKHKVPGFKDARAKDYRFVCTYHLT